MKKATIKMRYDKAIDLPAAFVLSGSDTFVVRDKITVADIITAAQSILTQQFKAFPLVLSKPNLVKQLAIFRLANMSLECFWVMFLDHQNRLIRFEQLFQGTISQTPVYPREIAKRAFELNASAIILVHNHPSGDCVPSAADEWLTLSIKSAFNLLDINIIDHLIVAGDQAYSFAENGKL